DGGSLPIADFSASPLSGAAPLTAAFTNLSQNSVSYLWEFGDGSTSTQLSPVHVYTQTGAYTVTLTAYDAGGWPDERTRASYITVTDPVSVTADFSATPLNGAAPLAVTFANLSTGATDYVWQFGDGATSTEINPTHTYTQTGIYTVSLTATGPGGVDTETKQNYITVTEVVSVQAGFTATPISGDAPLTVNFSDNSTGDIADYSWDFGDGGQAAEANPTHIYAESGAYTVTLTVTDSGGAQDTLVRPSYIFVNPAVVVPPNQTPAITITSPTEGEVVGSYSLQVSGDIADDSAVTSVLVNDVAATLNGNTFSANIVLSGGSQTIQAVVEDDEGAMGFDNIVVSVDDEGPIIDIHAPQDRQTVYSLNPTVTVSYADFLDTVDISSVLVQITDENNVTADVTNDLTITADDASGVLSTALTADMSYTLTVSAADTFGNNSNASATFYIPADPGSITLPEEPEDAGWVSGVVYDSSTCNDHLTTCQGVPGVHVTFSYAGGITDTITGTVVTGPDGFFAFPFGETDVYWL
ncbi:MAG: PKD domain-containing protein, partial [Chloroflexi bacterium]|nr:PKD domain-containing protein [Chloroflexota bacterium]